MPESLPPPAPPKDMAGQKKGMLGMFSGKKPAGPSLDTQELIERGNAMAARLRLSEERYAELRKQLVFLEQGMIKHRSKTQQDLKHIQQDIADMRSRAHEVEDRIITVIKEIRLLAKKEDVEVIRKYQDIWNPVKFVTVDRIDGLVSEAVAKYLASLKQPDPRPEGQWGPQ